MKLTELEEQALRLSPAERELLATRLLSSLDGEFDDDVDPAQLAEWNRRLDEMRADPSAGIAAEQVHREIKRKYGWT